MTSQVGRYRLLNELGRGAMGVVYLAEDPVLHRQVAVKTVDLQSSAPDQREFLLGQLFRDARAAAQLCHPNIVGVYDVFEQDGAAFLVMEYVPGQTLGDRLRQGPIAPSDLLQILREMAAALDYVHARGIIHRDIKPGNVMIDVRGAAKLMDFGIARLADTHTSTPTGMVMGTVEYMSPEQIKGELLDGRSDQFALAAVAYTGLTGGTMFGPHTVSTLIYKIMFETPEPVHARNPLLPASVDAALSRALSKAAAERFPSCSEFIAALTKAFENPPATELMQAPDLKAPAEPQTARTIFPAPEPFAAEPVAVSRRNVYPVLIGLLAAVALAGASLAVWKSHHRPAEADHAAAQTAQLTSPVPPEAPPAPVPGASSATPVVRMTTASRPAPLRGAPPPEPEPTSEIESEPDHSETGPTATYVQKGRELMQQHRYADAVEAFDQAVRNHPRNPAAYLGRGNAWQALSQCEEAIKDYSQVIALRPTHVIAYYERGVCLGRLRRDDQAMDDFETAMRLRPKYANPHYSEGMFFLRRDQYNRAIREFDKAVELAPNYARAYEGRSQAKRALGDIKGAEADQRKALELFDRASLEK